MKIAVVTGAGSGIGRVVAHALADAGYAVIVAGRRRQALEETASGRNIVIHPTDVGDPQQVQALFAMIREKYGRLDLLFNNAGIGARSVPIEDLTYEDWSAVVAANLTGAFLCAQQAVKLMKEQTPRGGRIVNNGSISAHTPRPMSAPYTATKHAITGLTKSIALDCRQFDICCGQIDIGNADSAMAAPMAAGIVQPNGQVIAEPRMRMEDVARAVLYMASLPLDTNVLSMTVMANGMPFVGRG